VSIFIFQIDTLEKVIIENLKWAQESNDKVEEKKQHRLLNKLRAAFSKKAKKRKPPKSTEGWVVSSGKSAIPQRSAYPQRSP
jgi:hypothetical protein